MAVVHPSGWREMIGPGAAQRELETLADLAARLPDDYTIFHGVHWTKLEGGYAVYGEVDFIIVAPNARVLLIEQKSGFLEETEEGLVKNYANKKKPVAPQIARAIEGLQGRYAKGHGGQRLTLDYILYCPDYAITKPHIAGIAPQHIVDSTRREQLASIIRSALAEGPVNPDLTKEICRFFEGVLELVPDIGAVSQEARALFSRISGGLATWGRRLELDPFRLRVIGTAGSGKTQLALAALRDAEAAGRKTLYVCFNRPLADHLAQLAPGNATVLSYHQLCDRILRSLGNAPDFANAEAFRTLEARFAASTPGPEWQFDELIVDEGQDFRQDWVAPLLKLLKPDGRAWWLEDPMQNLYGRPSVSLPGWATLHSDTNYRSPRDILTRINQLVGLERPITPGSPLAGTGVEILTYSNTAQLIDKTKEAIRLCLAASFKRDMITVITYHGRESSAFNPFDSIGPYRFRKFTGDYDLLGTPVYSDGDTTLETVFRFKGQSSPAVVFTEIDFENMDENAIRRIFVGATRATMKLVLVVSERTAAAFLERLGEPAAA